MSIENGPKQNDITESTALESNKKESVVLNLDAIKNIVISQIGNKATINRLEIMEAQEGAKISAEIDAGMLGGQISIEGSIINTPDGIVINNLSVDARGYVKSQIESNLSKFGPAIKKYFQKQYGKPMSSIKISGPNLIIEFEDNPEPKTQEDRIIGHLDNIEDPDIRRGSINNHIDDALKYGKYDYARRLANLFRDGKYDEKYREKWMAKIDKRQAKYK